MKFLIVAFCSIECSANSNKNQTAEKTQSIPAEYQLNIIALPTINGSDQNFLWATILEICSKISGNIYTPSNHIILLL